MYRSVIALLKRVFIASYSPDAQTEAFLQRAQKQQNAFADVMAAVPDSKESSQIFGVSLTRRGIQPLYLRITNRSNVPLRLKVVSIDPNYFSPLEAAALNHFSIFKRLTAFGVVGWVFFHLLLVVLPSKIITSFWANQRMDDYFLMRAFRIRPIPPGETSVGFVYTQFAAGAKVFQVSLYTTTPVTAGELAASTMEPVIDFSFSIPVVGIAPDYMRRDLAALLGRQAGVECDLSELARRITELPPATTNQQKKRFGDPLNLVVVGDFETVVTNFLGRWDVTEMLTLGSCWRTAKAFLLGSEYRYSPVSGLYLFGRSQDLAFQRIRHSINERLHLRLWLSPLCYQQAPVWVGQVSRDIGVRFTTQVWNFTTHRVDPDVDEARDYVLEDLLKLEHVAAAGYISGVGACNRSTPRYNLTGDPYVTDGMRVLIQLAPGRVQPRFFNWP